MKKSTKYMLIALFEIVLVAVALTGFYYISQSKPAETVKKEKTIEAPAKEEAKTTTFTSKYEKLTFDYNPELVTMTEKYEPGVDDGILYEIITLASSNYTLTFENGLTGIGGADPCIAEPESCKVVREFPVKLFGESKTLNLREDNIASDCMTEEECANDKTKRFTYVVGKDASVGTHVYTSRNIKPPQTGETYVNLINLENSEKTPSTNPDTIASDKNIQAILDILNSLRY